MADTTQHPVVGGPTKWDLSVALFDRKSVNCRKVVFRVNCPTIAEFSIVVDSVQAEDGSGESWNIEGTATRKTTNHLPQPPRRVFIYFRTDTRKGHIRFLS